MFANRGSHSQTQIGINIDLADTKSTGFQEHIFRNTLCAVKFTAVFIALFNKGGDNGRGAMQNQREAWQ